MYALKLVIAAAVALMAATLLAGTKPLLTPERPCIKATAMPVTWSSWTKCHW